MDYINFHYNTTFGSCSVSPYLCDIDVFLMSIAVLAELGKVGQQGYFPLTLHKRNKVRVR